MTTDRSHARVPHRTSRAASHASREARGVPSSVQGSGASRLARSPTCCRQQASAGGRRVAARPARSGVQRALLQRRLERRRLRLRRRRLPPRSHRRGAQHHLPGDRHDLAPRRRRTSPWWSRGLWLERDLPRKRVTRAGARLPREGRDLVSRPGGVPLRRCGARQPLFYASRASRRLCLKEGRYGSRSPSYAVAQRGAQPVQDIVPYLRMLVVGDIRARSYATGQQSLGDETIDVGATL